MRQQITRGSVGALMARLTSAHHLEQTPYVPVLFLAAGTILGQRYICHHAVDHRASQVSLITERSAEHSHLAARALAFYP